MRLGAAESLLWYFTIALEIVLAVLVLRRRGFRNLPFFTSYVLLATFRDFLVWVVYHWIGFNSRPAVYVAWSSQAILLLTRGAVCAELCWKILGKHSKEFWTMVRDLLLVVGAGVVLYTEIDSLRKLFHVASSVIAIERGLELAIALVLLVLLRVAFRYHVWIKRALFLIATGLCFNSLVQTINDTFLEWLHFKFPWWNDFHIVAFHVALALWIWAFAKRDFDSDDKPVPAVPNLYAEHAEAVSRKLRSLEKDLEEIDPK
jgi:hypothetical protein